MALITREPMNLLNRMQNEINHFFRQNGGRLAPPLLDETESWQAAEWAPLVDIEERDNQYVVTADIPGVDPKDIDVAMENGLLSIKGKRHSEVERKAANYRLQECSFGEFERTFRLPDSADSEQIKAKSKNGVLTVTIGKKETAKPHRIAIES